MQFENLSDFFAMGGHGLYVWLAYGAGLAVILLNVCAPILRKKQLFNDLKKRVRRER